MRFQVPQFINVEDKIFGSLTVKQFVYLVGGGGLAFVVWKLLPTFVAVMLILPIVALAGALAFFNVNGKPFVFILEAATKYLFTTKLYIWRKVEKQVVHTDKKIATPQNEMFVPRLSDSKLRHIAWSLDITKNTEK